MDNHVDWLESKAEVKEQPFVSNTPVIGSLIARFREAWNSVAAKWFVRAILQQQNEFNRLLVYRIQDLDQRVLAQDRDLVELRHDLAETTAALGATRRELAATKRRLEALEHQSAA